MMQRKRWNRARRDPSVGRLNRVFAKALFDDRKATKPKSRLALIDEWIENNPLFRLCGLLGAIVAFVVVVGTGWQIWSETEERQLEREFRRNAQIAQAYGILYRSVGGNTGKGEALTFLFNNGAMPNGLNTSCQETLGYVPNGAGCPNPPILTGLILDGMERQRLRAATGQNADINPFTYFDPLRESVYFRDVNLSGARIDEPVWRDVYFSNLRINDAYVFGLHGERVSFRPVESVSFRCVSCFFEDSWIDAKHWVLFGNEVRVVRGIVTVTALDILTFADTSSRFDLAWPPLSVVIGELPQIHLVEAYTEGGDEEIPAPTMDDALSIFEFCKAINGGAERESDNWLSNVRDPIFRDQIIHEFTISGTPAIVCGFAYEEVEATVGAEIQEWFND